MADPYARARGRTAAIARAWKTGTVTLTRKTRAAPDDETPAGSPGEVSSVDVYDLDARVNGVSAEYIDGKTILATDQMLIVSPQARHTLSDGDPVEGTPTVTLEPRKTDTLTIGGRALVIKKIERLPAAGDAVRFHVFIGS